MHPQKLLSAIQSPKSSPIRVLDKSHFMTPTSLHTNATLMCNDVGETVTLQELLRDALSKMTHSFVDVDNSVPATTKVHQKTASHLI